MNNFTYMKDREFSKGRSFLGASDAPTIAGINNEYQTPVDLFNIFTGRKEGFKGNVRTKAGHRHEPSILAQYIEKTTGSRTAANEFQVSRLYGDEVYEKYYSWTEAHYPENERIVSHADLLDMRSEIPVIVQAKNRGEFAAKARKRDPNKGYDPDDFSENGVPLSDYYQEMMEMICYGLPRAYLAVEIGGYDWRLYGPIEYNKKIAESLLSRYIKMLWHIDNDVAPKPETWGDVVQLNPIFEANTKAVVSGEDEILCREMLVKYPKIKRAIKRLEKRSNDISNAIGLYIGGKNYLETPDGDRIASAAEINGRESISVSELKKYPEIFDQVVELPNVYKKGDNFRNLYIKGANAGNVDAFTLLTYEGEKVKRSRKKYTPDEKKDADALLKSLKIDHKWERFES